MWKVNKHQRSYLPGKPLSLDLRSSIIDKIVQRGGNSTTGHFSGRYVDVASELNLSSAVVSKIWKQFCETNSLSPLKNGGGNKSGLSEGDLQLIEVVNPQPSTTYAELADILLEVGDIPRGGTSKTALSNAVRHRMPSQENFSYKKITHVAQERFTIQNMAYTQIFIDYLHTKDPYTLKYFDECGVKLPTDGSRHYGHAPIGNRAVEVKRYCQTANTTVNLMCSLTGVTYMNIIDGPSNTFEFLNFFQEAYASINPATGRPCLEVGDTIVMDNCPIHHNEAERILRDFLSDLNIELVFMPAYSPDFNPAEYVFGKLKFMLKYKFWELTNTDLKQALYTAINFVTPGDMRAFYEITGYLDP